MFILSPDTVLNASALDIRWLPRRFLGLTAVWPRGGGVRLWARLIFEKEVLRYGLTLLPFVAAALIWRDYAVVIAQAPIPMLICIYLVESKLLRASEARRKTLVSDAEAEAGLDTLRARAKRLLSRIAARRGLTDGRLHLVIEQSDLLLLPPLTLVSVQAEEGPDLLALDAEERAMIADELFAPPLTERALQHIGLARRTGTHDLTFDPATVSAHARMAALMAAQQSEKGAASAG